jgi:hypothetical protein
MTQSSFRQEEAKQSCIEWSTLLRYSSPLISTLAQACVEDEEILELGSVARPGQPLCLLILLSAQYLLLKSPGSPLARYFPSLATDPLPAGQAFPAFREFCLDRRAQLLELIASRTVNSTMVERSSCILPVLRHVSRRVEEPLTLIEMCCSAGVNLLLDEYHYDYGALGQVGAEDSSVRLACKAVGSSAPPVDAIPVIAARVGVDLVKVDASDPSERLWMEAMLCPEWTAEIANLKAALALRASRNIRTVIGDAVEVLPELLTELPGSLCLLHSFCIGQFPTEARSRLDHILRSASREREIHRVGLERPDPETPAGFRGRLAKLASAGIPLQQKSFPARIEHTRYANAQAETRFLGEADGFGAWIAWH